MKTLKFKDNMFFAGFISTSTLLLGYDNINHAKQA